MKLLVRPGKRYVCSQSQLVCAELRRLPPIKYNFYEGRRQESKPQHTKNIAGRHMFGGGDISDRSRFSGSEQFEPAVSAIEGSDKRPVRHGAACWLTSSGKQQLDLLSAFAQIKPDLELLVFFSGARYATMVGEAEDAP